MTKKYVCATKTYFRGTKTMVADPQTIF